MENENFEKEIYDLIDNANCDIPSFKTKKKRHFPIKMLLVSLSTVCAVLIFFVTVNLNDTDSKNAASEAMQNEVNNNIPQGNVPAEESMEASLPGNDECQGSGHQGSGFQEPGLSEQVSSEASPSDSNTTLSSF